MVPEQAFSEGGMSSSFGKKRKNAGRSEKHQFTPEQVTDAQFDTPAEGGMSSNFGKKRKNAGRSDKHQFTLEQEMDAHFDKPGKKRPGKNRKRQESEEYVTPGMSNKILREARRQQKEVDNERDDEAGLSSAKKAFSLIIEETKSDSDEDDFDGLSETQSQYEEFDDEKVLAAFMSENSGPQRTLADLIMEKIREKDAAVTSASQAIPRALSLKQYGRNRFLKVTCAGLMKIAEMEYCGTNRYKNELTKEDKNNFECLVRHQKHYLVTPEIQN